MWMPTRPPFAELDMVIAKERKTVRASHVWRTTCKGTRNMELQCMQGRCYLEPSQSVRNKERAYNGGVTHLSWSTFHLTADS